MIPKAVKQLSGNIMLYLLDLEMNSLIANQSPVASILAGL
ncbi:hypothetical protein QO004_005264 [Rhizobium mesoamericanum]|nr:hypothetical protein [Rhizobium mesoamericanum]